MAKWQWQRSDLEAMVKVLVLAAEQSGLHSKNLEGLGAETKHQQYLKYLCAVGLLYLAQEKGKNKVSHLTEENVYLPLPSAEPIIRQVWRLEEEKNEGHRRELLATACWSILYREPIWRIFMDIQMALFLGLLYLDHGRAEMVRQNLEEHPTLAAICAPFFAHAKTQPHCNPRDRLDGSAYTLRERAEELLGFRAFYDTFQQVAEAHGLKFGDLSINWSRWRTYWLAANEMPVLLTGQWLTIEDDRRALAALLALESDPDAVVSVEALGWNISDLESRLMRFWLLGLPLAEYAGEMRPLRPVEWLDVNPERTKELWLLPNGAAFLSGATAKEWKEELRCLGSRRIANDLLPPRLRHFDQEMMVRLNNATDSNFPFPIALIPSAVPGPCYGQSIPAEDFVSDQPTKVSRHHPYLFVLNLLVDYIRNEVWYHRSEVQIVPNARDYLLVVDSHAAPLGALITKLLKMWNFTVLPIKTYEPLWMEADKQGLLPPGDSHWNQIYARQVAYDGEWREKISEPLREKVVEQLIGLLRLWEEGGA